MAGTDYEITVSGRIPESALIEMEGMRVVPAPPHVPAETVIRGPVLDQSALIGIINRLQSVGIDLLEVRRVGPDKRPDQADQH